MTDFLRTVAAYLTGWLIVQPLYNRLLRAWRRQHLDKPSAEDRAYFGHIAAILREELVPPMPPTLYPYRDGDTLVLGPGVIAEADHRVINWRGENYYQART